MAGLCAFLDFIAEDVGLESVLVKVKDLVGMAANRNFNKLAVLVSDGDIMVYHTVSDGRYSTIALK